MAHIPWRRAEALAQLKRLARDNRIHVHWRNGPGWLNEAMAHTSASAGRRTVVIPRPYNARQYLVALHEFGHLLGPLPEAQRLAHPWTSAEWKLISEGAAWGWAMEHIPDRLDVAITAHDLACTAGTGFWTHAWDVAHVARH